MKTTTSGCSESKKWAVNWSPLPIFNNQIFTRGSSIYIESVGSPVALPLEDVRFAYQTALSLWAIALQDRKKDLGTEVMKYIDQSTASGGSVNLFTPPQVIRVDCPENALAIVKWYSSRGAVFPEYESDYVAKAQVQGRTILLNANDNRFHADKDYWKTLGPENINLVTVFVHEIGHSFGLPDRFDSEPSVMNPEYVIDRLNQLVSPQEADTFAFAQVLKASIQGSAPGAFNAENCAGLRCKKAHSSRIEDELRPMSGLPETGPRLGSNNVRTRG